MYNIYIYICIYVVYYPMTYPLCNGYQPTIVEPRKGGAGAAPVEGGVGWWLIFGLAVVCFKIADGHIHIYIYIILE